MKFVGNIKTPLSNEEIEKYFIEYNNGDLRAKKIIMEHNIRLVLESISKFQKNFCDEEELFYYGLEGLNKAIETFDLSKNIRFSTYATKLINYAILNAIKKQNIYYFHNISLNGEYSSGNSFVYEDILFSECDVALDFEEKVLKKENLIKLKIAMKYLDDRERNIIQLRFGFINHKIYNQEEIAKKLGISRSYVSMLIDKIIIKIKNIFDDIDREKLAIKADIKNFLEEEIIQSKQHVAYEMGQKNIYRKKEIMNKLEIYAENAFEMYKEYIKKFINYIYDYNEKSVLLLSLGFIRGRYFNLEEIGIYLNISQDEAALFLNRALEKINNLINNEKTRAKLL